MQTFQRGNFYWRQLNLTFQDYTQFNARLRLDPTRSIMFNHMEKRISIANKHGLIKSLAAYYYQLEPAIKSDYTVFDSTPTTFVIASTSGSANSTGLNEFILLQ